MTEPERRTLVVPRPAATPDPERVDPKRPQNDPETVPLPHVLPDRRRVA